MNTLNKKILVLYMAALITVPALLLHGNTVLHEQAHKNVYQDHNCTQINITYSYLNLSNDRLAQTEAMCPLNTPGMEKEHDKIHEIQGYADIGYLILIGLYSFLLTIYTIPRLTSGEES